MGTRTAAEVERELSERTLEPEERTVTVLSDRSAPAPFDSTRSQNIPYLLGVDHLRAAAALLIFYYHGVQLFSSHTRYGRMFAPSDWQTAPDPFSALILEGHTAVALFITLSGFIFAFGATDRAVSYRQFLANRFLRTYPLLIFVVLVGAAAHHQSLSLLPLLQLLFGGGNLPGSQWLGNFSAMLWSVSLEWQLYLLFPALMLMLNRAGPGRMLSLVALVLLTRGLAFLQGMNPVHSLYVELLGRVDQFLFGMIAGWAYAKHRHRRPEGSARGARGQGAFHQLLLPAAFFAFAGAYAFNRGGGWPQIAGWKLLTPSLEGLVWAGVILGYVAWSDRREGRPALLARAFARIGAASYSIYLWHFVLIQVQRERLGVPRWLEQPALNAALVATLTTLPVTLLFATLSYHVIEKPFLNLRRRYLATREPRILQTARA